MHNSRAIGVAPALPRRIGAGLLGLSLLALAAVTDARAGVRNLKVVTDAAPDYSDMPSMIHSITSRWPTTREKCWAMFYWNHVARRQTAPMMRHGMALTDPIRQFNDYGYMMCSTIAGTNCAIWHNMGLKVKYWDISLHTVPECFYDGRWHMYDNSMSAIYTLCDGKTIAGVQDIGASGACAASDGRTEPGHVAKYHCLNATSPNGFLTGADCNRDLAQEYRCFNPKALKYRYYFNDWDYGHRYILGLRRGEAYTRFYASKGDGPRWYVPNAGKDPEAAGKYGLRGNGVWRFSPPMTADGWAGAAHSAEHVAAAKGGGRRPDRPGTGAWVVYKIQAANVVTSQTIKAAFHRRSARDEASISVSTNNGLKWTRLWRAAEAGDVSASLDLLDEVNGAYEVLIRIEMKAASAPEDVVLKSLDVQTRTQLNAKTQPRLNLGRNVVYVGAGEQVGSVVLWPELQGDKYKRYIVEESNIACDAKHIGYQGVVYPAAGKKDAWLVFRIDAPGDLTRVAYGGRFYNRAPGSRIQLLHSFDGGKNWTATWTLTDVKPPWDVIHYETVDIPAGHRSVWIKYRMNSPVGERSACSIYAVRMEANHKLADEAFEPVDVTFRWSERRADRSLVGRSHTQPVTKLPFRYVVNVGGADHPVMDSLEIALRGAAPAAKPGYSDGKDVGGEKFVGRWQTVGRNLAVGRPYTVSVPSQTNWGAGDGDGTKLTDGVVGPPYAGGTSYRSGAIWSGGKNPVITLDLGKAEACASFGMNFHGYPFWDALKGQVKDEVEVLVSDDGKAYTSIGRLDTDLRWKLLPVNHMWPDHEVIQGHTFRLIPNKPAKARFVRYRVKSKRFFACTELEVLDAIRSDPFDLRIALPDDGKQ